MRALLLLLLHACESPTVCPSGPPGFRDATGLLSEERVRQLEAFVRAYDDETRHPACMEVVAWGSSFTWIDRLEGDLTVRVSASVLSDRMFEAVGHHTLRAALCEAHLQSLPRPDGEVFRQDDPWLQDEAPSVLRDRLSSSDKALTEAEAAWVAWCAAGRLPSAALWSLVEATCGGDAWPDPLAVLHAEHWAADPRPALRPVPLRVEELADPPVPDGRDGEWLQLWPQSLRHDASWGVGGPEAPAQPLLWVDDALVPWAGGPLAAILGYWSFFPAGEEVLAYSWQEDDLGRRLGSTLWAVDRHTGRVRGVETDPGVLDEVVYGSDGTAWLFRLVHGGAVRMAVYDPATGGLRSTGEVLRAERPVPGAPLSSRVRTPQRWPLLGTVRPWQFEPEVPEVHVAGAGVVPLRFVGFEQVVRDPQGRWWSTGSVDRAELVTRHIPDGVTEIGVLCERRVPLRLHPFEDGAALTWSEGSRGKRARLVLGAP